MIPMRTVYGEDITAPFAVADGGDDDDGRRRRGPLLVTVCAGRRVPESVLTSRRRGAPGAQVRGLRARAPSRAAHAISDGQLSARALSSRSRKVPRGAVHETPMTSRRGKPWRPRRPGGAKFVPLLG